VSQIGKASHLHGRKVISFCALRARVPLYYSPSIIPGAVAFTAGHYTLDLRLHPWNIIIPRLLPSQQGITPWTSCSTLGDTGNVYFLAKNFQSSTFKKPWLQLERKKKGVSNLNRLKA